jgi:AraC-like DNA-binding protein
MATQGAYGNGLGNSFGLEDPPTIATRTPRKATLAVTELRDDNPNCKIMTTPIPYEDAFLFGLQLRDVPRHEIWLDGRPTHAAPFKTGVTCIYDLRHDPIAYVDCPYHSMHFYVPRAALDEIANEVNGRRCDDLSYKKGAGIDDLTIYHLANSLRHTLQQPDQISTLFVDQVMLAFRAHCATTYAGVRVDRLPRGGLAPWQERHAKEVMNAHLDGEIPLAELARECGLSPGHFARAFRQSTGRSPHYWLMERRIDAAKNLMLKGTLPLATIAIECGFVDQSHFTRAFAKMVGLSPGLWRRANKT